MQITSDFITYVRRNFDILPAFLLFSFVASTLFWMPAVAGVSWEVLAIAASPILTTIGVFMAHRLNEKIRNPKLRFIGWGVYRITDSSVRIFAEVENAAGREIARDAKAIITIKKIENGEEKPLETADLIPREQLIFYDVPLVPYETVRVEGEPIPWVIPEVPCQSRGLHNIALKHITNIGPSQRNKANILEVVRLKDDPSYYLRVFSEYGTKIVKIPSSTTYMLRINRGHRGSATYKLRKNRSFYAVRRVRCVLKPGIYKFYLQISADKAYPVTGVMEVDTVKGVIRFLKPRQTPISLSELEPTELSSLQQSELRSLLL